MSDLNGRMKNIPTSFANGTCRLVENEADALKDRPESLRSQLQAVCLLFEDLVMFGQTKAHVPAECIYRIHSLRLGIRLPGLWLQNEKSIEI